MLNLARIKGIFKAVLGLGARDICLADRRQGFDCVNLGYDEEVDGQRAISLVGRHTMTAYASLVVLWQQVRHLDRTGIPGCLVECGTWRGGAAGLMGLAHMSAGVPFRTLHLFDSFQGLPHPDARNDGPDAMSYSGGHGDGEMKSIGLCVGTLEENRALLRGVVGYPEDKISFHVGWFKDTIPAFASKRDPIAVLRIDADWYDSVRQCLAELYANVVPGGFVIIDDYGAWAGCRKATDEFLQGLPARPFLNHIDRASRYFIKPS